MTVRYAIKVGILAGLLAGSAAQAQYDYRACRVGSPDFDACSARVNNNMQMRSVQAQNQIFASYMRRYGPWVRKQYAAYRGPPISFQRFAYFEMMSANGTNVAGGLKAQRDQFAGQQRAQATRNEGYSSYRQGMYANSARMSRSAERFDQNVIRGNVAQIDPNTGKKHWLPNSAPEDQPFNQGGQTYVQHQGSFYKHSGNGWVPMQAGR